jgi:hypothetical protein
MIRLTRLAQNREAPVYINPALIEFIRVPVREDRTGRLMAEDGAEVGTVSGERFRVIESPAEVAQLISSREMIGAG